MEPYIFKRVDTDGLTFTYDQIYADCQFRGRKYGANYYMIGLAGSYENESNSIISDLFAAKFDTFKNLTEWNYRSDYPQANERVRGVHLDRQTDRVFVALDINVNNYLNNTVHRAGEKPQPNNANIAITCFDEHYATRLWSAVVGDNTYQDYFVNMGSYGNYLYVATNSFSTKYNSDATKTDI